MTPQTPRAVRALILSIAGAAVLGAAGCKIPAPSTDVPPPPSQLAPAPVYPSVPDPGMPDPGAPVPDPGMPVPDPGMPEPDPGMPEPDPYPEPDPGMPEPDPAPDGMAPTEMEQEAIDLSNAERAANGCDVPLVADPALTAAARGHSEDMAANEFMSHDGSDGSTPWERADEAGYDGSATSENAASGQETAEDVVDGWMGSPGHRENILNCESDEVGVGFAEGGMYGTSWTQLFGQG